MLVCTANRPNGWNHSVTNDHFNRTLKQSIFRVNGAEITYHPQSGRVWKYGNASDKQAAMNAINRKIEQLGLEAGALDHYTPPNTDRQS